MLIDYQKYDIEGFQGQHSNEILIPCHAGPPPLKFKRFTKTQPSQRDLDGSLQTQNSGKVFRLNLITLI
jgi:hypothetical protein